MKKKVMRKRIAGLEKDTAELVAYQVELEKTLEMVQAEVECLRAIKEDVINAVYGKGQKPTTHEEFELSLISAQYDVLAHLYEDAQ